MVASERTPFADVSGAPRLQSCSTVGPRLLPRRADTAVECPVIVLGGGGHGRVVIDALQCANIEILGVVDLTPAVASALPAGVPYLGDEQAVRGYSQHAVMLVNGVGSFRSTAAREEIFERFSALGYRFMSITHTRAVVARKVDIGEGTEIMAGAVVQTGTTTGRNCIINSGAIVEHDCRLGDHVHVAPGATLCGGVIIGPRTHVGSGATVIQGVTIGAECLVGAGALVLRNVPDGMRVIGVGNLRSVL